MNRYCFGCGCYIPDGFTECPSCNRPVVNSKHMLATELIAPDDGVVTFLYNGEEVKTYISKFEEFPVDTLRSGRTINGDIIREAISTKRKFTLIEV